MKKNLLLLGAALVAVSASAQNFAKGEAFSYDFKPGVFEWNVTKADGEKYGQYPYEALKGQAIFDLNLGYTSMFFSQIENPVPGALDTPESCLAVCPAVNYPAEGQYAVVMQANAWWAYGNFNFALPQVGEPCRIRVVLKTDVTGVENTWYTAGDGKKPFSVKLMDDSDQDTPDYPEIGTSNDEFWTNPGWYVYEFVSNLDVDGYYISLLWNAAGLSCSRNVPVYVREVSVVPVSKLPGYEAPADGKQVTVLAEAPELVTVTGDAGVENVAADSNAAAEYFNLQGIRVAEPANGIFIRRQGFKATKVIL